MSKALIKKPEWVVLTDHQKNWKNKDISSLFEDNPNRFKDFSVTLKGLTFDYSKQPVTSKTIALLSDLAESSYLNQYKQKLFNGDIVNPTENRAAWHTELRNPNTQYENIGEQLHRMRFVSERIRSQEWKGCTGKSIRNIVHIGIGGSYLGPRMVCHALKKYSHPDLSIFYLSNIDGDAIANILKKCDPETTLFIVASKTFSTQETIENAKSCKRWLESNLRKHNCFKKHFIALTSNKEAAKAFGISEENILLFWNWVNGRFSLWSTIGLPISISIGHDHFEKLLEGAHTIDHHFLSSSPKENIPILMAMLSIWNRNFFDRKVESVISYSESLSYFPSYLQQLIMESGGKSSDLQNNIISDYQTSSIVLGAIGTNAQHSFFQLLHQGTDIIPCDLIGFIHADHHYSQHHKILLNNMIAQGQALMQGRSSQNSHKAFGGSRPVNTILLDRLDAYHLGMLIALYEHKTFVQSVIWNINCFDQFGVELGKSIATDFQNDDLTKSDPSTKALYSLIHKSGK